jgi:hypothetical protein
MTPKPCAAANPAIASLLQSTLPAGREVRHFGIRSVLIEPGKTATGIKECELHKGPADYAGLWEQWTGAHDKMTGPSGAPGPEGVAFAKRRDFSLHVGEFWARRRFD